MALKKRVVQTGGEVAAQLLVVDGMRLMATHLLSQVKVVVEGGGRLAAAMSSETNTATAILSTADRKSGEMVRPAADVATITRPHRRWQNMAGGPETIPKICLNGQAKRRILSTTAEVLSTRPENFSRWRSRLSRTHQG